MAITASRRRFPRVWFATEAAAFGLACGALLLADQASARPAQPMTAPHDRVGLIEGVPAMAGGLSRVVSREAEPAAHILADRHRFQMSGVHARPVAAHMIDVQAGRDRANHPLIHHTMRGAVLAFDEQRSIAAVAQRASPNPASVVLLDARQHAVQWISRWSSYLPRSATRTLAIEDVFPVPVVVGESVFSLLQPYSFALACGHVAL